MIVLLEVVLQFLPVMSSLNTVEVNDDNPVFRHTANRDYFWSKGWNFSTVIKRHVNNYGFVNDLDYNETIDSPPMIAVIGDNFVVASMIPYQDTVQGRLAKRVADQGRIYSFAAGGAPLSQYLAYAEYVGSTFAPEALIFVITYNTFENNLLSKKSVPGFNYFLEEEDGELGLKRTDFEPNFIRRTVRQSALARYLAWNLSVPDLLGKLPANLWRNEVQPEEHDSEEPQRVEREQVTNAIRAIEAFLEQLPTRSQLPKSRHLFVVDAVRPKLYSSTGLASAPTTFYGLTRRHFLDAAEQRGYEVIDMQPLFLRRYQEDGLRFEFARDNHWNGHAHGVAAEAIESSETYARGLGIRD